jgi:LEA14-like dessication related protein
MKPLFKLLAALVIPVFAACSALAPKFEKPDISVAGVELVGGNLLQQNFAVKLNIHNPNKRAVPVTSVHVELMISGDKVASGVNTRPFVVPAGGETQFDMTITANMALALLKYAGRTDKQSDSIDYDLVGGASIDLPFLRDLPFRQSGSFRFSTR